MPSFPDPRPGDFIEAAWFKSLYDALDRGIQVVPPLFVTSDGAIALGEQPGIWIEFTGAPSGGGHPWKQVLPQPGGTWTDGAMAGTTGDDPAWELNGNSATLTGRRARAWRDRTSYEMRFAYSACP